MNTIKGIVLISRFEFIEIKFGKEALKSIFKEISTPDENYEKQPVIGANMYPENTLVKIDELILKKYFKGDVEKFREVGGQISALVMNKFFNLYIEEQAPGEFLFQYSRLRPFLIGTGKMTVSMKNNRSLLVRIDYEQSVPKSVSLSELGFLESGLKLCGAAKLKIVQSHPETDSDSFICEYDIKLD